MTCSAAGSVNIRGFDYLNQPMMETVVGIVGDVETKKAFKRITQIEPVVAGNITVKLGTKYGLPFAAIQIVRETADGVISANGTIVVPPLIAQTATTDDPRGTYNPNTAGDGLKDVSVALASTNDTIGGLYGRRHFAA